MAQAKDLSFILLGEDRSASRTMTAVQKTAEVVTARIGGAFQKVGGIIGGEFGNVISTVGGGIDELGTKTQHLATILTVGGGVALTAGLALQRFGSGLQQSTDQLNATILATGEATTDYADRIDKAVKKGENFDHSAVDTKNALAILATQTGDTGKALDTMGVVTDLAARKHISLSDAATLVNRIMQGTGARTLVQYGIHMDGVGTKTEQGTRALDELSKKLNGQAKASVNNFGSQVDIVKTKVSDFAEEVAGPVGGALTALGGVATATGLVLEIVKAKQTAAAASALALAAATDAAAVSQVAATGTTEGLTVATTALDAAMDANPIGIVAGAIGVLGAVAGGVALASIVGLTGATTDYTSALKEDSGAIGVNTRALAANALEKDGALAAAARLGISGSLVVDAALGEKGARAELTAQIKAQTAAANDGSGATAENIRQVGLAKAAAVVLTNTVAGESAALASNTATLDQTNRALLTYTQRANAASGARYAGQAAAYVSSPSKHAGGGDIMSSQYSVVGENGPEIVRLPGGSHVFPNGQGPTSSGGGAMALTINVNAAQGDQRTIGKAVVDSIIAAGRSGAFSVVELQKAIGL